MYLFLNGVFYLTEKVKNNSNGNLPKKIFGIHRKHRNSEFEEIVFDWESIFIE